MVLRKTRCAIPVSLMFGIQTLSLLKTTGISALPQKAMVIRVRWPLVIFCSYLILYSQSFPSENVIPFVFFYIFSNGVLYFAKDHLFRLPYFYGPLVIFDTFCLSASIALSGYAGTDFYVACFVTILLCCIARDFYGTLTVAVLGPIIYGSFLFHSTQSDDPGIYLRFALPFVISIFYGYFVQVEQTQKKLKELEKANRAKDEFLSVVSHELRTPLNVILGFAGMMSNRSMGEINQEQENALERVTRCSRDLLEIIDDILSAASLEAGAIKVMSNEFSLKDFLEKLRSDYNCYSHRELTLEWDYPADLPVVRIDDQKLRHILQNLINNAIKFTPKGIVAISARYNPEPKTVELRVTDTGPGIPKENIPMIFERFRQLDSSETRPHGGVGLGLYIAKQFTGMLGGEINVDSEPGKGSTFIVTLPALNGLSPPSN